MGLTLESSPSIDSNPSCRERLESMDFDQIVEELDQVHREWHDCAHKGADLGMRVQRALAHMETVLKTVQDYSVTGPMATAYSELVLGLNEFKGA